MHISSVMPPEMVYKNMVEDNRNIDTLNQLIRRIDRIVYHYIEDNEYKSLSVSGSEYKDYDTLKECVNSGFVSCNDNIFIA